ncbi:hypothetical protein C8R44DRAFT_716 [Mycena epipterygia]|nr:hypothetical protein C8R44DRAFT_716 [Mycena epipterygia]
MASKKRDSDRPSGTNLPMSNTTPGTPSTPNITPREPSGPGSAQRSMTPSRSTIEVPPTSSTNIHIIVKAQIVFLLSTLTKDNFERNQIEIRSLSEQHGIDIYLHFIRRLIIHSQVRLSPSAAPSAFELSTSLTFRFLIQETKRLARDPLLAGRFRDGIDKIALEDEVFRHFNLVRFSARVGLCPLEKLILAASIFSAPTRKKLVTQASRIIRVEFDSAVLELCQSPCFEQSDLSPSQVAKLMSNLLSDPPSDSPVLDATQRRALILAAQSKYGKETIAPILHRVVVCLSLPPGLSLVRVLFQLGPEITSDREVVRALLGRFNISAVQPPGENLITEIMSTLTHLATGGKTECDADVDLETWLTDNIEPQAVWPVILWVAFQVKAKYSPPTLGPPSMDGLLEIIGSTADQNLGLWQWDAADEHLLRQTFISQDSTISSWIDRYPLAWREYIRLPRSRDWARLDALTRQISRPRLDPTEYDAAIRISFIVLWTSSNPIFASQENNIILNRFVADMVENMYMVNHVPRALPQRFISCVFSCLLRKFSDDE